MQRPVNFEPTLAFVAHDPV